MTWLRGKPDGAFLGFPMIWLVIFVIIVGLTEPLAQASSVSQVAERSEAKPFFREWAAKDRGHVPLRTTRWLIGAVVACLLGIACLLPCTFPPTAEGAEKDASRYLWMEPVGSLAESIYRLPVYVSVLHTGAHPDDENNALLAYLARGVMARTAYLSLTRGDGGQNRIGLELSEALGVIRSEELLAARQVDGAEQFFTRAYDFGFSKSAEESLAKWGHEEILGDIVRVIRTFRPDVIISRFAGQASDGHGHHQAAGLLTREAFVAAGDPQRFPGQIAEGLPPWQAKKLFWNEFRSSRRAATEKPVGNVTVDLGVYSPLLEKTYYQLGINAQNRHRSQLPPRLPRHGKRLDGFERLDVAGDNSSHDLFEGMDLTLLRLANMLPEGTVERDRLRAELAMLHTIATTAAERFRPQDPSTIIPLLSQGYEHIRRLRAMLVTWRVDALAAEGIDFALHIKEQEFRTALERALGLAFEAVAAERNAVRGGTLAVTVSLINHSSHTIALEAVQVKTPMGWQVDPPAFQETLLTPRQEVTLTFQVHIPQDTALTQPYWLEGPRDGDRFSVSPSTSLMYPFAPPLLRASFRWRLQEGGFGSAVSAERAVEFPVAERGIEMARETIHVVPELSVSLDPPLLIAPLTDQPVQKEVRVTALGNMAGDGALRVQVPEGWAVEPIEQRITIAAAGQEVVRRFTIQIPALGAEGRFRIRAMVDFQGKQFASGYRVIAYPHIRSHHLYRGAVAHGEVFKIATAPGLTLGYVLGAGDNIPEALAQLGLGVSLLSGEDLAGADLSRYDTIVVGVRAYEFRPDLVANQQRLLDYVRDGGTLIVQYQTLRAEGITFTPFPAKLSRNRVVDETAPVTIMEAAHPIFRWPNVITERDFDGWVQERGLYFLEEWDTRFIPLLESHDPGEPPQRGGMLIAPYGKGQYIYTGYAWFRQLPAGVPGAFRLFANLLSLPRAP